MWFFKTVRANESQGWKSVRTASVHTPPTLHHHPYTHTHTHTVSFYCPSEVSDSISCLLQSAARMLMNTKHATFASHQMWIRLLLLQTLSRYATAVLLVVGQLVVPAPI